MDKRPFVGATPVCGVGENTIHINARALTILKLVHNSRRNHVSETARASTTLTLAHSSRHNHVGVNARARTTLTSAHNSRRHHVRVTVCAPAAITVHQHRRLLRAVRGVLRFEKTQQCAPAPHRRHGTSTPVDTRWWTCNCDISNSNGSAVERQYEFAPDFHIHTSTRPAASYTARLKYSQRGSSQTAKHARTTCRKNGEAVYLQPGIIQKHHIINET